MSQEWVDLLLQPGNVVPQRTIVLVMVGMAILAAVDIWRSEVEDYAVLGLLGATAIGLHIEDIELHQWLSASLVAAVAFMVYLNLGQRGVLGGGDVKLSVVPAFVLGSANPFVGLWWIAGAFLIHQAIFLIVTSGREREAIPHVPAMAAATIVAAFAFPSLI